MNKIYLILTVFACLLQLFSCAKVDDEPEIYCYSPVVPYIRLNWLDSNGSDLIFDEDAAYTIEDISFITDYNGQVFDAEDLHLMVDSVTSDTTSVVMSFLGNGKLFLGNLPEDHLTFNFESISDNPCAAPEFTSLLINDSIYCAPCSFSQQIILMK